MCQVCHLGFFFPPPTQLQSLPSQPHYLDGFEVLYRSLLPATSDWAAKKVSLPSFQAQTGPLTRGYKYEFKVRPYGGSLYGRESNTRHLRVPETGISKPFVLQFKFQASETAVTGFCFFPAVPSAPPQTVSVTVSHEQNDTIRLSWEPPPLDAHNGIIQGYEVAPQNTSSLRDPFRKCSKCAPPVTRRTSTGCAVSRLGDCVPACSETQNDLFWGVSSKS